MRRTYMVFLVLAVLPGVAQATTYKVPGDYERVSDALAIVVDGDIVQVQPGSHTDVKNWSMPYGVTNITIEGIGQASYWVPESIRNTAVSLASDAKLRNIRIGSDAEIIVEVYGTGVEITGVVINPFDSSSLTVAIEFNPRSSGAVHNCTIVGPFGTHEEKWGVLVSGEVSADVSDCLFKDLEKGVLGYPVMSYNAFDNVGEPAYDTDLGPGSLPDIDSQIDPVTFVPLYGSPLVDAGDPELVEADLTPSDIGIPRTQTTFAIALGAKPTSTFGGGNNPSQDFVAGDRFDLYAVQTKPEGLPHLNQEEADFFLVLETCGQYFFWPSWRSSSPDWETVTISDGYYREWCLVSFIWPAGVGSGSARFWACTAREGDSGTEFGPLPHCDFTFSP